MSVNECSNSFTNITLIRKNEATSPLLRLPKEVLEIIGFWVAKDTAPGKNDAARNAMIWGRICVATHLSSHAGRVAQIIQDARKKIMENGALQKIWNLISNQLNFQGNPHSTQAEIETYLVAHLHQLFLNAQQISVIPDSFGRCSQLTKLYLDNNRLTLIPASLGNCATLKDLSLQGNLIKVIPDSLSLCPKLKYLYLSHNLIIAIPDSLGNCVNLGILSLNNNLISVIPRSLSQCAKLTTLQLKGNPIAIVPDFFDPRVKLEVDPPPSD